MKKFYYIFIIFLGLSFSVMAQQRISADPGLQPVKILKFYPNPASSAINFDFQRNYDKSFSLVVFNFMGKKVYELKNIASRMNLNLEDFYRGVYVFQLRDRFGATVESGKFQVIK